MICKNIRQNHMNLEINIVSVLLFWLFHKQDKICLASTCKMLCYPFNYVYIVEQLNTVICILIYSCTWIIIHFAFPLIKSSSDKCQLLSGIADAKTLQFCIYFTLIRPMRIFPL